MPLLYPISYVREQDLGAEVQRRAAVSCLSRQDTQSKQTLTREVQSCGPVRNNTLSNDIALMPSVLSVHIPQRCKPATFSFNKITCPARSRSVHTSLGLGS